MKRSERLKRTLMMCCALILFALGVWLLVEPVQARGSEYHFSDQHESLRTSELVDNVDAPFLQSGEKCDGSQVTVAG